MLPHRTELRALFALTVVLLVASAAIGPADWLTWCLEVSWVVVALPLLVLTRRAFPMTPLVYRLMFAHAVILIIGGHYTYAQVPLGRWFADWLDLSRNHYDRLGHLAQGFVPAIFARELLLRTSPLRSGGWLFSTSAAFCLAFSAFFEMIEWWAALIYGSDATAYLATQGDVWDTQWDMFLCLVGALTSLTLLSRAHDRQLARLGLN
ncbi:MAG: DUF2238 domain-containing protein [Phycisphaera sp.]|nr:DUF2238 domain-containing protein [Phycisphaera sp.]